MAERLDVRDVTIPRLHGHTPEVLASTTPVGYGQGCIWDLSRPTSTVPDTRTHMDRWSELQTKMATVRQELAAISSRSKERQLSGKFVGRIAPDEDVSTERERSSSKRRSHSTVTEPTFARRFSEARLNIAPTGAGAQHKEEERRSPMDAEGQYATPVHFGRRRI